MFFKVVLKKVQSFIVVYINFKVVKNILYKTKSYAFYTK